MKKPKKKRIKKNKIKKMIDNILTFKILTLGESSVGKTCILRRFVEGQFFKNQLSTIGIDFKAKTLKIGEHDIRLKIWDTAGEERFRHITSQYYKGAEGIILVYDLTKRETFEKINDWMTQIKNNTRSNEISIVLLGNKKDMEEKRVVSFQEGKEIADQFGVKFFETSAFDGSGINEAFEKLTEDIMSKKEIQFQKGTFVLGKQKTNISKNGCCQ